MIYTITHDLRSPLAQIVSLTDLVKSEKDDSDKWLDIIKLAAQQELRFIDNYLSMLETIEYDIGKHAKVEVTILSLVDQVIEMLKVQLTDKEIGVEVNVSPTAVIFTTKELLFERVVRNLLTNAIKFSNIGGVIKVDTSFLQGQTIL
jgi:signal transduction histidine kinase